MFDLFHKKSNISDEVTVSKSIGYYFIASAVILLAAGIFQGVVLALLMLMGFNLENSSVANLFLCSVVIAVIFVFARADKRTFPSMGLVRKHFFSHYLLGHLLGFGTLGGALLITYLLGGAVFQGFVLENTGIWLLYFIGFMIQGFEEELLCRGFMMFGLSKKMSIFGAMMINSLYFAALHLGNPGISVLAFVNLFLAGLTFSVMAVYFDDLWVASGAHSMWNFAQGNIFGILVSGMNMGPTLFRFELQGADFLSGAQFGLEGGIGVMVIEILTIFAFCLLYKMKKRKMS